MKRLNVILCFMLFIVFAFTQGCVVSNANSGKIPITTKSETAQELYLQGRDLQERLRANEAHTFFQQAVAEDANFALAYLGCAQTAPSAKAFFNYLDKAVTLAANASEGEKLSIEGFKAGVDGQTAKQRELYQKLVAAFPDDERAHNVLGGFYFGQQEYDSAIAEYEKAVEINPQFSQPYNQLGYSHRFLGEFDKALLTFKKYIEVLPNDPNPYDSYAELLLKLGRYDESIENYRKALAINSEFVASDLGIATNYNYKGDYAAAREQLDKLSAKAKNDGQRRAAHFAKTISYVFEGDLENALRQQEMQYKLAAKITDAAAMSGDLTTMGNLLVQFGREDQAKEKYEAALKLNLESDLSEQQKALAKQFHRANLFQVAESKGDVAIARELAMKFKEDAEAVANRFQIRLAHEMLGRIALLEENFDTAQSELQQANQLNPQNLFRMGLACEGKGEQMQAKEWFEKATNFNPVNSMNQAFVALKANKMAKAKS